MITPENFMRMVSDLPERERTVFQKTWDDVYSRVVAQSTNLGRYDAIRLAIASGYLQAVYDGINNRELIELKNRIVKLF